jgi:hypothetical protein
VQHVIVGVGPPSTSIAAVISQDVGALVYHTGPTCC